MNSKIRVIKIFKRYGFYLILLAILLTGILSKMMFAMRQVIASDNCQAAVVFYDMISNGNFLFKGWYWTTAPLLFIDFPFYLAGGLIFGMNQLTLKLIAFFIFSLSVLLLSLIILRKFGPVAALLNAVFLFSISVFSSAIVLQPYIHVGTIGISFLGFILLLTAINRNKHAATGSNIYIYFMLFVLSALSVFSDPYYIFIFIFPVIGSYILLKAAGIDIVYKKEAMLLIISLLSSVVLGLGLHHIVGIFGIYMYQMPALPVSSFPHFIGNVKYYLHSIFVLLQMDFYEDISFSVKTFITFCNFIIISTVVLNSFVILRKEKQADIKFTLIYFIMQFLVLSLVFVFKSETSERYLTPVVYISALFFSISASGRYNSGKKFRLFLAVLFVVSFLFNTFEGFKFKAVQPEDHLLKYLKEENLSYGYSSYSYSNLLTLLSGNNIKVRAVHFDGNVIEPYNWITNAQWFKTSAFEGPTFLIVPDGEGYGFSELTPEIIGELLGKPEKVQMVGGIKIYIWPYNIMKMSRRIAFSEITPHSIGKMEKTAEGNIMHSSNGQEGLLVYGPAWALYKGTYRARYILSCYGSENQEVAQVGISIFDKNNQNRKPVYIMKRVLGNSCLDWKEYSVDFIAEPNKDGNLIYDFLVYATGANEVRVLSIYLEER